MLRTRSPLLIKMLSIATAGLLAVTAAVLTASPANADTDQTGLPTDMPAYCATHLPFSAQTDINGWIVSPDGITGTHGANNWGCHYQLIAKIPAGKSSFTIPYPIPYTVPIDFRDLCNWLYPGATTDWSTTNGDWTCIGQPGRIYTSQGLDGTMNYVDQ